MPRRKWLMGGALAGVMLTMVAAVFAAPMGTDYVIGPGDAIQLMVFGEPDLSKEYLVGPGGSVTIPLVGQVVVADLSLAQAQELLAERLRSVLRVPRVQVGLNESASVRKVYVLGYVGTQGSMLLPFGAGVLDALAVAGVTDISDLRKVQITRVGEEAQTIDLSGVRTGQRIPADKKVGYGDVIFVPRLEDRVAVLGLVKTPGSVVLPLGQEVNVLDALARIGGGLAEGAVPGTALLVHQTGAATSLDLQALLRDGDTSQNHLLKAGDALVVQQSDNISVVGEVNRPVTFGGVTEVTVLQALAQAEGYTPKADREHARIIGAGGESRPVNVKALTDEGDLSQNLKLHPGDALFFPERRPENLQVVGKVEHPGVMDLVEQEQRDILRIVTAAGELPESDLTRVRVFRGEQTFAVNVVAVREGDLKNNIQLQPDDIVLVPEKSAVYVFGTVLRQGRVSWDSKLKVLDAISAAGGLGLRANENGTVLLRAKPEGTTEVVHVRMGDLAKGKAVDNVDLEPGDIIYVPNLGERGGLMNTLRDLLYIGTVIAAFDR